MFKIRPLKKKAGIGLDIASGEVRVVELAKRNNLFQLSRFGIEPAGGAKDKAALAEVIKKAMDKAGIASKEVNTSVSGQSVIVRYVELPKMTKEELDGAIRFEAEKYVPFNINDVVLDCQILKELRDGKMQVLLVAAKKDLIDDRIKLLEAAGLKPNLIDIDSFALINSFQRANPQGASGTVALLNLEAGLISINILKDNISCFTRDIFLDTNLSAEGVDTGSKVVEEVTKEVRLSFDYYENQFEKDIGKIFVSGELSDSGGFVEPLRQNLKMEITGWDPVKDLELDPAVDKKKLADVSKKLTIAIGLALRKN